jgi:Protein of unknown function (DUF2637)
MLHGTYSAMETAPYDRSSAAGSLQWIRRTTVVSVALLAAFAAAVSFGHMRELAFRHGEHGWSATLIPLSVDGMVVAASMSVLLASRMGRRGEWLPWVLLIVGSLASLAANVAVASPDTVSRLIAAWPSFAFVGSYHLLQGQVRLGRVTPPALLDEPDAIPQGHTLGIGSTSLLENPGRRLQRQAWEWALANRSEDGRLPAGAVIARRFNRSPRWGRLVKKAGNAGSLR